MLPRVVEAALRASEPSTAPVADAPGKAALLTGAGCSSSTTKCATPGDGPEPA